MNDTVNFISFIWEARDRRSGALHKPFSQTSVLWKIQRWFKMILINNNVASRGETIAIIYELIAMKL